MPPNPNSPTQNIRKIIEACSPVSKLEILGLPELVVTGSWLCRSLRKPEVESSKWVRRQINKQQLNEGIDFVPFGNPYRRQTDVYISLDAAIDIAEAEQTENGRLTGRYLTDHHTKILRLRLELQQDDYPHRVPLPFDIPDHEQHLIKESLWYWADRALTGPSRPGQRDHDGDDLAVFRHQSMAARLVGHMQNEFVHAFTKNHPTGFSRLDLIEFTHSFRPVEAEQRFLESLYV
jgi:phage anti-repressor protein